uniref:CHK domain-containing protein n=1 Tax=Globodera pallida TaxID=36090 RepID=A0A183CRN2_GLOPA
VRAVLEAMARVHATAWAHPAEWQQMVLADYDDNGTPTYWALEPFFISSVTDGGKEIAKIEPNAIGPLIHRLLPIYRKDFH